jgi:hypothetical protein
MWTLADYAPLFDDVEMFYWPIARLDDALVCSVETQLTLLDKVGQMSAFHLVERREFLQELHRAVNVLQNGCFACLGESVRFAHDRYRLFL